MQKLYWNVEELECYMRFGLSFDFHHQITVCESTKIKFMWKLERKMGGSNFVVKLRRNFPMVYAKLRSRWLYSLVVIKCTIIGHRHSPTIVHNSFVYELILPIFNTKLLQCKTNILTKFGFPKALSCLQ